MVRTAASAALLYLRTTRQGAGRALARVPWLLIAAAAAGCDAGSATGPKNQQADPALGQRLLAQYQCGSCHAIPGVAAARGRVGPSLEAFGKRSYIAGHLPNSEQLLARWIVEPAALVPDTAMPSMGVSPLDARHMAAYLGSLQ
jgi:cytochrome c